MYFFLIFFTCYNFILIFFRSEIRNLKLEQDHNFDEQQDNLLKTVENLSSKLQVLLKLVSEILYIFLLECNAFVQLRSCYYLHITYVVRGSNLMFSFSVTTF